AMDDPAIVRVGQRSRDVAQNAHRLRDRERASGAEASPKALPLDERHRVERDAARFTRAEHGNDVRLLQRCGELDLPLEPFRPDAWRELRGQQLEDDLSTETRLVGHEDA